MLGPLIRVLFAATAIAPLTVSLAYIYATKDHNLILAGVAFLCCVMLGWLCLMIIGQAKKRLESLTINIKKAKSADKEVIGYFIAYALPLLFRGQAPADVGTWLLAGTMLFFVLWTTHSLQVNPVLGFFGYHFYEVETSDGISYLLITKRRITNLISIREVVLLNEYGILERDSRTGSRG